MSATATVAPQAAPQAGFTHRQILTILSGLLLGMFLAALDQTIVASAIRTVADDLKGLSIQAWVTTAYLITSTIATPLYGKLSDIYGRRPLFLTAITLFIIGSLASGFAHSMYQLAAFRAFQGLGAGGLFSLALAIIADIVSPRDRAKYQGYFLAVFGISSVLGPVIGGFFAGQSHILGITGWRWVFLVNVPIGIVALVVVSRVLHLPHHKLDHRIDWWGATALVVGLVPLLIVAEQGREWGWGSASSLAMYVLGVVGIIAFILIERAMKDEALLPLRLFRNGVFSLGSMVSALVGMAMFGAIAALPLYLQIVKGASPTKAGLLLLPLMGGLMVASAMSGLIISKTGRYKIFPIAGTALITTGFALLYFIGVDTALWKTDLVMVVIGVGLGCLMQTLVLAIQNASPPSDMGVATAAATFFRQIGATLGTAVFLSLLFNSLPDKVSSAFTAAKATPSFNEALADPANQAALEKLGNPGSALQSDSSFLSHLDPRLARPFLVGFTESTHLVYVLAALIGVLALALVLFLKEVPLRMKSGFEEAQAQRAAAAAGLEAAGNDDEPDAEPVALGAAHVDADEDPAPPALR